MQDPKGGKAPSGGFQNGGWYNGYQYYNGSFAPQAGMIHPQSPQSGAGQAVSQEVNRQTSVAAGLAPNANQNFVNQQNATPNVVPSNVANPGGGVGGSGGGGIPGGIGAGDPSVPDLSALYDSLYASSGIKALEADLSAKEKAKTEATGVINDNPFLAEASRVGRVAKLEQLFNERTANIKNDIATKKADVETKLNLETKQFDINSQAAQQSLSRLNTLLQGGFLDNASGEDIANLTRSTGISSDAIRGAIDASKAGKVQTQVMTSTNDAGMVTATVINSQTGEIIKSTSLGNIGNAQTGGGKASESEQKNYYQEKLRESAQKGLTLSQVFGAFTGFLPPDEIYQLYNANSKYGPDKGSIKNLAKYGVTQPKL